jgi:sugar lactone lactonase YvrE
LYHLIKGDTMKKLIVIISFLMVFVSLSLAQVWTYDSDFAETTSPHGIVVTPDGKIWVGTYGDTDSILVGGVWQPVNSIRVYNPDGTLDHLIQMLTIGGVTDTLWNTCRGMSLDNNGNVLYSNWFLMWRINYQTYEAMNRQDPFVGNSITKMACDDNGFIYVHRVVASGIPLAIYDDAFDLYAELDSSWAITRALETDGDGNNIFLGRIYGGVNNGITHYRSDDGSGPDGTYSVVDTVWRGIWAGSSLDWDNNGLLWAGSYWDVGATEWGGWYAIDTSQNYAIVDTLRHFVGSRSGTAPVVGLPHFLAPRGAAWSADGQTMYANDFDGSIVKKWTNSSPVMPGATPIWIYTSIDNKGQNPIIAVDFDLSQNYPNPFNPETKIPFDITKKFHVKLVVYDMLGRQVATLVDDDLTPNHYEFTFDGTNFSSGTYFYQLIVDGAAQTKQMMLIK